MGSPAPSSDRPADGPGPPSKAEGTAVAMTTDNGALHMGGGEPKHLGKVGDGRSKIGLFYQHQMLGTGREPEWQLRDFHRFDCHSWTLVGDEALGWI